MWLLSNEICFNAQREKKECNTLTTNENDVLVELNKTYY